MEERQIPIVVLIMAVFLGLALVINDIDYESFSIPQVLGSYRIWLLWKSMPGW